MKSTVIVLVVVGIVGVAAFMFGRTTVATGIPTADVADLLREAGDSAVTAYLGSDDMAEFVEEALGDTIQFYQAEVKAAARIVVRRDTLRIVDTIPLADAVLDSGATATDTVLLALPIIDSAGVVLAESLTVAPRPVLLLRHASLAFRPDTILAAMLTTPEGIDRFTAAATRAGLSVGVADAAQLTQSDPKVLRGVSTALVGLGCGLAGFFIGQESTVGALVGGGICAAGIGIKLGIPRL